MNLSSRSLIELSFSCIRTFYEVGFVGVLFDDLNRFSGIQTLYTFSILLPYDGAQ